MTATQSGDRQDSHHNGSDPNTKIPVRAGPSRKDNRIDPGGADAESTDHRCLIASPETEIWVTMDSPPAGKVNAKSMNK